MTAAPILCPESGPHASAWCCPSLRPCTAHVFTWRGRVDGRWYRLQCKWCGTVLHKEES